jgi:NTP pyrophosphatase (non-canonical NTP hydrolase)
MDNMLLAQHELADVLLYLIRLSDKLGIDLATIAKDKLESILSSIP